MAWLRAIHASLFALLGACAGVRPTAAPPLAPRTAELARVRCLLVLPFENASTVASAGGSATAAALAGVDAKRTAAFPVQELRALFRDTPFELPPGVSPSLALELAELLEADAALYGVVEGRAQDGSSTLAVTLRVELAGSRDLLFAVTAPVEIAAGEEPDPAIARAVAAEASPLFGSLGGEIQPSGCFDPARTARLRTLALSQVEPTTPETPPGKAAVGAPIRSPAARLTARQASWAKRLVAGDRFALEGISFEGRTAQLGKDAGLADLAKAMGAAPKVKIRIEGFVDPGSGPNEDTRLSMAMAQSAGRRLAELGVPKERISWAGRGATRPMLPNFTIRGRAANRRLEVVGLK